LTSNTERMAKVKKEQTQTDVMGNVNGTRMVKLREPKQSQIFKNAFKRDVFRACARLPLAVPECQPETHRKIRRAHNNYFTLRENRWFRFLQILVRVNVSFSKRY
jgi:hypothetical protein